MKRVIEKEGRNNFEKQFEQKQFEGLINGLISKNYGCSDNFIKPITINGLRNKISGFKNTGEMYPAGIGNHHIFNQNKQIRGDTIKWLDQLSEDEHETIFLNKMDHFIEYLNESCFTSINRFESHYSSYAQNSFYKKHLDQFQNDRGRKYSVILYLNEKWKKEDGGKLSLYPEGGRKKNIAPLGGRLVFFRSDEMVHEVQPSLTRERMSIAGWFKS